MRRTARRASTLQRKAPVSKPIRRNTRKALPKPETNSSTRDWSIVRIIGVGIAFTLLFFALWYRAFDLQIMRGPELAEQARKQYITTEYVTGVRGNIMDRNGNILARSIDTGSIWADATKVADKETTAAALASILGVDKQRILSLLNQKRKFVWLKRQVDRDVTEKITASGFKGIYVSHEYARAYPYKNLAGQLLGFVDVDGKGLEGLEKSFNDVLSGERVKQIVQRDAAGRRMVVRGSSSADDLRGRDIRLTLDANIQFFAEEALAEYVEKYEAKWGGAIVVDVPTGEILAWAQYPFFNPNEYKKYAADTRRNKLAMDALEQGSTIKAFLIAAAMEEKVVNADTMIFCENGKWKFGKFFIHDTHPYENLPVKKILHVSSNIGSAKIGKRLGSVKYHSYLSQLGFGSKTGLPLAGEAKGILRPAKAWQDIDLATASFGQSFSATLAQMAQAYLHIANDGTKDTLKMVTETPAPYVSDDGSFCMVPEALAEDSASSPTTNSGNTQKSERVFSSSTTSQLRAMLREVVEEDGGTGRQARISGMEVGGKTGTAQKADKSGRYGRGRVASFVGMVPIEKPRYLVCVLMDEPTKNQYGGTVAAPVFRHVALNTMAYQGLLPDSDDPVVARAKAREMEKQQKGKQAGLKTTQQKSKNTQEQIGIAQTGISGSTLDQTADAADRVPFVTGMSLQRAVKIFANHGVIPEIKGSGSVVGIQAPEAGTTWSGEKSCTLWLQERAL